MHICFVFLIKYSEFSIQYAISCIIPAHPNNAAKLAPMPFRCDGCYSNWLVATVSCTVYLGYASYC